jgi:hypothetical protein
MAAQSHIVQQLRLSLEVESETERDYSLLLDELSRLGNNVLPQVLDKALTSMFPNGDYWRVDRLEVEVEVDSLDEIVSALQRVLPQQLRRALREKSIPARANGQLSKMMAGDGPGQWLYQFLRSGSLPMSAPRKLSLLELAEISQTWLASQPVWQRRLYRLLRRQPQALWRLIQHLGAEWLWQFVRQLVGEKTPKQTFQDWQLARQYQRIMQEGKANVLQFWQAELAEVAPLVSGFRATASKERDLGLTSEDVTDKEGEENLLPAQYYVEEAGLVLLHPFMVNLLSTLGLAEDGVVKDVEQAASVLYSVAWGTAPEAEWQLVLPKLLLGVPLDQLVEVQEVTQAQIEAGEEMIAAAIGHWSVLGNTSVNGFRESFLQRPGRLDRTDEGWSIVLEQRPYDMLLEQLPWQMSFVQLPWMDQVIRMSI